MKSMTWTIKYETMDGQVREAKQTAETLEQAVRDLCDSVRVGNVLSAKDCYRVQWL